jgi:hypothetical protein
VLQNIVKFYPWIEEKVKLLVQQRLILLVAEAEILKELVRQSHQLVHAHVLFLVIGDLQQVQHHSVNTNVAQQPLLVLAGLDYAPRAHLGA